MTLSHSLPPEATVTPENESPLIVDTADGVATLTLNRPQRLNALNPALVSALHDYFAGLNSRSAERVVVLRGAGRAFCAGLDLSDAKVGAPVGEMLDQQQRIRDIVLAMRRCPIATSTRPSRNSPRAGSHCAS